MKTPIVRNSKIDVQHDDVIHNGKKYSLDPNLNDYYFYKGIAGVRREANDCECEFLILIKNGHKIIMSTDYYSLNK